MVSCNKAALAWPIQRIELEPYTIYKYKCMLLSNRLDITYFCSTHTHTPHKEYSSFLEFRRLVWERKTHHNHSLICVSFEFRANEMVAIDLVNRKKDVHYLNWCSSQHSHQIEREILQTLFSIILPVHTVMGYITSTIRTMFHQFFIKRELSKMCVLNWFLIRAICISIHTQKERKRERDSLMLQYSQMSKLFGFSCTPKFQIEGMLLIIIAPNKAQLLSNGW